MDVIKSIGGTREKGPEMTNSGEVSVSSCVVVHRSLVETTVSCLDPEESESKARSFPGFGSSADSLCHPFHFQ